MLSSTPNLWSSLATLAASTSLANVSLVSVDSCWAYETATLPALLTLAVTVVSAAARYDRPASMSKAAGDACASGGGEGGAGGDDLLKICGHHRAHPNPPPPPSRAHPRRHL